MRRMLILFLALAAAACSPVASPTPSPTPEAPPTYTGLNLESLGTYRATFDMRFEGDFDWAYQLETRTDGRVVEQRLHLEGLDTARNPGDVRIVMEGDVVRMRGPGTDDECWQFPNELDLGPAFLTPDDLIDPEGFREPLVALGVKTIAGVETTHYSLGQAALDDWHEIEAELWLDQATGAVLRYDLRAAGPDPLFDAGEGALSWEFVVDQVGAQTIEPITGCDIDLPMPPDATDLVRLPGLIAFLSSSGATQIAAFYEDALSQAGWDALAEPESGDDTILLSYRRDVRTLEITIKARDEDTYIELVVSEE